MFVIGTAGHVDHGKSTLVRALTGIDPDRLKEEKQRGLTIELGFAWMTLPSGREIGIVDVPGHERFIKNMLMGVGGVDVALLVVAADEGVMPQTREHLAIIDLLGIKRGVVALTKSDLSDAELLSLVTEDIETLLEGTSLAGSPIVPVSAQETTGLASLRSALDTALDAAIAKPDLGRPRLPVDRSFTISGFGTVVTGTLADGVLVVGQEVEILPSGRKARIRGLQSHERTIDRAVPGSRVAVNLSGVDHSGINRGDVVAIPGWLHPTLVFDASFRTVPVAPRSVRHNHRVTVFASTFEVEAALRILGREQIPPGEDGWVQLKLNSPAPLVKGDHFVVRDSNDTLGGGRVLDLMPRRYRRNDPAAIQRLESLAVGGSGNAILAAIHRSQPTTTAALGRAANISADEAAAAVTDLVSTGLAVLLEPAGVLFTTDAWRLVETTTVDALSGFHSRYPLRPGMPREELRGRLKLKATDFPAVLQALAASNLVALDGSTIRIPAHKPTLSPALEEEAARYIAALSSNRFAPPNTPVDPELLQLLIHRGEVVRASDDVVFLADTYREMSERLVRHAEQHGEIAIEDVRSLYRTSRKYTLALLEQMDRDNLTIRRGDVRTLRR